jgi:hypothetical protein
VSWLEVLALIGIIGFVIYQQLAGQLLRGKRVVVLPVPEKDGSTFLGGGFCGHDRDASGRY